MMRRLRPILLTAMLALAAPAGATAYTTTATGVNWSSSTHWSPAGVPGSGDTATNAALRGAGHDGADIGAVAMAAAASGSKGGHSGRSGESGTVTFNPFGLLLRALIAERCHA